MRYTLFVITLLSPLTYAEDLTHLIDVYRHEGSVNFTNTSDLTLRCQISSRVDPSLPLGTIAEKRNITLDRYMSFTHYRSPRETIIYCERQEDIPHDRVDD